MLSKTLSFGENKWDLKEGESSMDPNVAVENLSVSLKSCEPFCTTEIDSSKSLVAEDTLRTDVIVGALNSISIAEPSGQKDDEGKDTVRYDDSSETKCPDIVCSSPQRSNNMNGLQLKTETTRASRKGRKISSKKLLLDLNSLKVSRRRRSYFCKKTRLSDWGSLENIGHVFKQNAEFEVNQIEHKKLTEARSGRRGAKRNKNQKPPSSQMSKEESHASTSCIRLKVKLGKEVGHSCPMDIIPVAVNDGKNYCGTRIKSPKFTKSIENKFEEQIPSNAGVKYCNGKMDKAILLSGACVLDVVQLADKDSAEKVVGKIADDHDGVPAQKEANLLEVAEDNRCLDPGTSPDSEVINLIPEGQISGKISEVLDDVLITSQGCVALGDVSSLSLPQPSSKKGNMKNKLRQTVNCNVEGDLLGPEIINSAGVTEKYGYLEGMGDGTFSSEASISTTSGNASVNTSSGDVFSMENPLPSSRVTDFGVSSETLKVESGSVGDLCSTLGVRHELGIPDKFLPCANKKGHKLSKSSKSTKSRSEVPQPMCSKGNSCRQKGNQSKRNVKEKGDGVQAIFKENDSEKGCHTLDLGESKTGCSTAPDVSYLGLVTSGVRDQYVPPRNAWVSCDDCYKWRRIPVALADSIEETKSRWICKDNMDKNLADCSIPQEKSNADINAELDISDASCEEDAGDALLNSNRLGQKQSTVSQQSSWKLIRSNLFLHRTRKTQIIDEIMVCHCKAPLGGRMGCGDGCLNRMLNIECVKGTCPCGELCSNNQFQKRKYAKLKCFRSGKKGYGLQLLEDIHEGQFLIEYVGEVLDMHAYENRQREYALKGHKHFYFMTLNGSEVIDACAKGNLGRFINHSCEPNCRTEKWMVNGEVCIGIFALRDIKKGEEVTFDYNYVRVFGAAAKKCVCGSSLCRGYIGGDPLNAEVIVQGDSDEEYLEPVIFSEDGGDNLGNIASATSSVDVTKTGTAEKDVNQPANDVEHLDVTKEMHTPKSLSLERKETDNVAIPGFMEMPSENEDSTQRASSAGSKLESLIKMDGLGLSQSMQTLENSLQPDDGKCEITSAAQQESSVAEEAMYKSLSTIRRSETSSTTRTLSKSLLDASDIKRKSKYDTKEDRNVVSTSRPIMKTSRSSSSVKKGKSRKSDVHVNKPAEIVNKLHQVPHRSKKLMEGSSNDPFEAVQVKLNELLDADGGISKRKDASRGYLKLLFLTAASGDSGNGEAIQSNRDLSMILDALLKTKSRTVLVDIINKNGLQMLHNIMKRYRKEFHKIPILRKLLKVLEYLAAREILTLEHITSGPRCAGVESFRESILSLTEHIDKQVHQIARNFRDKWIPWPIRKRSYMDRDVGRMDFHRGASNCNRLSALHSQSCDLGRRQPEAIDHIKQPLPATTKDGAGSLDSCSASCSSGFVTNETRIRKRKSRWDQPAETNLGIGSSPHKEPRIQPRFIQKSHLSPQPEIIEVPFDHVTGIIGEDKSFSRSVDHSSQQINTKNVDDGGQNFDEDVPPGFSPLNGSLVSSNASSTAAGLHQESGFRSEYPCEAVMGQPQERFISRLPMSFGIPLPAVQQFGTPQGETAESLAVAAGIPFHPYPPLPPYPHDRRGPTPAASSLTVKSAVKVEGFRNPSTHHSDQNILSTSSANPPHMEIPGSINQHNFQRIRGTSNCLGRKYFRQQKWNNAKMVPPLFRSRPGRGNMGNNPGNGMNCIGIGTGVNEPKHPYNSEQIHGVVICGNTSYQHRQHQN